MFSGKTALIIEDDRVSIKVLQHLLDQVGIDSAVISDNQDIESKLHAVSVPDVVFIDLQMPKLNGYMVLKHLHNLPQFRGVPTVAYTTYTSHLNDAKNAGFHSFLGKPLDGERFPEHLSNILNGVPVWEISH